MTERAAIRRRDLAALAVLFAAPGAGAATRPRRIGFLLGVGQPQLVTAFKDELRRLGWREGRNLAIELRESRPNTSDNAAMAAELAAMDLELVVAASLPVALEVRRANPSMPMVIATCPGMVSNGFARSLERPGGIVTGMDELPPGVTARRLILLRMAAPHVSRIALLSTTPGVGGYETQLAEAEASAARMRVQVKPYRAANLAQLQEALRAIGEDGMDGLLNFQGGLSLANRQLIVDYAAGRRLPAIYQAAAFAEAGGLMAWAPDLNAQFAMAGRYVDKILRGARPGDLPIHHPERYYLTVNAEAARGLGLALPAELVVRADRVIT